MKIGNQAFENSLRCLQHPVTLLSITLLLLNDHVLKVISPSWLTGKLSDFAGLFFFPFIVAAGLSVLLSRFDLKPRIIGQVSFAFVAIWLIFLKTSPYINSLTSQFASFVVGFPAQFILDWTDIVGLIAMLPAWKMWNQKSALKPRRLAYVALSIGALAALATSPIEQTVYSVTDLEYYKDGVVYAADRENYDDMNPQTATSNDGGITWEGPYTESVELKSLPIIHCSHLIPELCYRITSRGNLEESEDRGEEWTFITAAAYDLILFEWKDKEYVIVAIGEWGILRRELPDGDWQTIPVLGAEK